MIDTLKLLFVFVAIIIALNRRLELGAALCAGAIVLGLLFGRSAGQLAEDVWSTLTSYETIRLLVVVLSIMILSEVQRTANLTKPMVHALLSLFSDARVVLAVVPALVGLLPMPGGAMFSAPMVEEVGKSIEVTGNEKAFANYWFRHVWEYVLPLYPSVVITAVLLSVSVGTLIRHQWPLTLAAIVGGALVIGTWAPKNGPGVSQDDRGKSLLTLVRSVWSVVLIVVLTMFLDLDMLIALPIAIVLLVLVERLSWKQVGSSVIRGLDWHIVLVLAGVMVFKYMIQVTGAVENASGSLVAVGVPSLAMVALIPFVVGLATGMPSTAFAVGIPVILPFLQQGGGVYLPHTLVMYAGGLTGVMLSPVHLCLILTRDFFGANWLKMFLPSAFAQAVVVTTAVVLALAGF